MNYNNTVSPELVSYLDGNRLEIKLIKGEIFGPQPFLAIKTKTGMYFHDNLDVIEPGKTWSFIFDEQTLSIENISKIGVGTAGKYGKSSVSLIEL